MKCSLPIFFALFMAVLSLKGNGNGEKPSPTTPYKHERFFTTFGYGACFPAYKQLNYVFDRYNSRPGIIQPMQHIGAMVGFNISAGSTNDSYLLEFSYAQRRAATVGRVAEQGYITTREVVIRDNKLGAGLAVKVYQKGRFKFYAGGSVNFGYLNIFSRTYRSIDITKPPIEKVGIGNLQLGLSVAPQIHFVLDKAARLRIVAKPFVSFEFLEAYYGDLNKVVNPGTYNEDNNNNLYNRPWAGGIELKFYVAL